MRKVLKSDHYRLERRCVPCNKSFFNHLQLRFHQEQTHGKFSEPDDFPQNFRQKKYCYSALICRSCPDERFDSIHRFHEHVLDHKKGREEELETKFFHCSKCRTKTFKSEVRFPKNYFEIFFNSIENIIELVEIFIISTLNI